MESNEKEVHAFMKISIITPSFNSGRYIEGSIQSVLNQSYDNWEHIIIDGGSSDSTLDIIKKHSHLKWVSEADRGIYDAMNKGLIIAQGDWIYFMGADDAFYGTNVLETIVQEMRGFDVIYGDVKSERLGELHNGEFDRERLFKMNICHQAVFLNRKVFEKVGNFNVNFKLHADWAHNMKWFCNKSIRKKYIPLKIAIYGDSGLSSAKMDSDFDKVKQEYFNKYCRNRADLAKQIILQIRRRLRRAFHQKKLDS